MRETLHRSKRQQWLQFFTVTVNYVFFMDETFVFFVEYGTEHVFMISLSAISGPRSQTLLVDEAHAWRWGHRVPLQ